MATLATLLCALLATGPGYDLGLRLEGRGAQAGTVRAALDLEVAPTLSVHTQPGELVTTFTYAPRLIVDQQSGQAVTATLHSLRATETVAPGPTTRLLFEQHLVAGQSFFSLLQSQGGPLLTPERIPVAGSLATLDWGGSATLSTAFTRRLSAALSMAYTVSGGLDDASRVSLPLQHGVSAKASLDWVLTRLDSLQLTLTGAGSSLGPGKLSEFLGATAGWTGRLTSDASADLSVGANLAHSTLTGAPPDSVLPAGSAGLAFRMSERSLPGSLSLRAALTAAIDPLTVQVYQRAEARAALELAPVSSVKLSLRGLAARAFGVIAGTVAEGEAAAAFRLAAPLSFTVGARAAWLSQALAPTGLDRFQWTAFVGLTAAQSGSF